MAKEANKEVNLEKLKALQLTMDKLDKTYGKGSVMKLGDSPIEEVEVIPSGSITFKIFPSRLIFLALYISSN